VIGGVFNSGLLADPRPGADYDYAVAPRPVLERALRLQTHCERHGLPLRAVAARFPLAHPAVAGVLIGMRNADEAHDAARQWRRAIPGALWRELRAESLLRADAPVPEED
jgi:D-threo-aldose 1-dehydrogenase